MSDLAKSATIVFNLPATPAMKALFERKPHIQEWNNASDEKRTPATGVRLTSKFKLNAEDNAYEAQVEPYGFIEMDFTRRVKLPREIKQKNIFQLTVHVVCPYISGEANNQLVVRLATDSERQASFSRAFENILETSEPTKTYPSPIRCHPRKISRHDDAESMSRLNKDMTLEQIANFFDYLESEQFMTDISRAGYNPQFQNGVCAVSDIPKNER